MRHKAPTKAEQSGRAHAMLKSAGYSAGGCAKLASGGSVKGPKTVNVIIKTGGGDADKKAALQQGMMLGAKMAAGSQPPMPPPGGPPGMAPGAGPPGMPPGMPPKPGMPPGGMMNKGGVVKVRAHSRRKGGCIP